MPRDALLCVRTITTETPAVGAPYSRPTWPAAIVTWRRCDAGWYELDLANGTQLHACDVARNAAGDRALVLVAGPRAVIDAIAAVSDNAWPLATLWTAGTAAAIAVRQRWPWWRISGTEIATSRVLTDERVTLPTPFPSDPKAIVLPASYGGYSITTIHRPGFGRTIAGYTDAEDAEATT